MASNKPWKQIKAASSSLRISNPIRDIVDRMQATNPNKPTIALSIGDPTVFGNFNDPDSLNESVIQNIKTRKFNGYAHSAGYPDSKKAVAEYYNSPESPLTQDDVVLTSGCSGALELAMSVLANEGDNILLPAPGFSLYQTMCDYKGIAHKFYHLNPAKNWEIDLGHLESLIDSKTVAILVNNPSNPCGSVYSKEHLTDILKLAERHHLPIIADEIYGDMVFKGNTFYGLGTLSKTVPVLSVGGIGKVFLVPGWRLGWVVIYDRNKLFAEVRTGLLKLSQIILGPNTLVQSALRDALFHTPKQFHDEVNQQLEQNATYLYERLSKIHGLKPIKTGGTMYLMFSLETKQFKDIPDDVEFAVKLLAEESVSVLPATIFKWPHCIRLVICPPMDKLKEACDRIELFCKNHAI